MKDEGRLIMEAVARVKQGDMDALDFLYVRFSGDVLRYVRSMVHDHHEAEDITQNVFAKLMTAIQKYEQQEVPFAAWMLRVARNAALDHMRAARRVDPCEEVRVDDDDHARVSAELANDLRQALRQLPQGQREVVVLRHIVGLSPTEIAVALGKTESSVHGLHNRGRRTLRLALVKLGSAPAGATR
jgi:RNA polymerase sigma-70 factor, ECF subfamily